MKKLFIILMIAASAISCTKDTIDINGESITRLEFIGNKSELDIKNEYLELTFQEQKSLWKNKFEQVLSSTFAFLKRELTEK
jgi:hypothetical protein